MKNKLFYKNLIYGIIFIILLSFLILFTIFYIKHKFLSNHVEQSIIKIFTNDVNLNKYSIEIIDVNLIKQDKYNYIGKIKILHDGKQRYFPIKVLSNDGRIMWETPFGSYSFDSSMNE